MDFDSLKDDSALAQPADVSSQLQQPSAVPSFDSLQDDGDKYGTGEQMLKTFGEGVGQGVAGPLAPMGEKAAGVDPKEILARQENNPITHYAGEIAGLVLPAVVTAGGSLAAKAGLETTAAALPMLSKVSQAGLMDAATHFLPVAGETLAGKIGVGAAKAAIENMMLAGSDEASKMILNDPHTSAETAISTVGLSGVLGAGLGATGGAVSKLWNAAFGERMGQLAADFKGRINEHINNPEPVPAITDELNQYLGEINKVGSETFGDAGIKAEAIKSLLPEMSEKISTKVSDIHDSLSNAFEKMAAKNDPHASLLKEKLEKFSTKASGDDPAKIFDAIQDLKKDLQADSRYTEGVSPLNERSYRNTVKSLAYDLRTTLEDRDIWGKAGDVQASINSAFSDFLKASKDFKGLMTTEVMGQRVIDPAKVNTYLNQLGKAQAEIKSVKLRNFLDAGDQFKASVAKTYDRLGLESPIQNIPMNMTLASLNEKTAGSKMADQFIKHGLTGAGGKALGATVGGGLGHVMGSGEIGALIGAHALGPFFSSILPGIAKSLVGKEASGIGMKGAVDFAANVQRGDTLLTRGAKNIFKIGSEVLPESEHPTESDRVKIAKAIDAMQKDPTKALNQNSITAHYLPEHSSALQMTQSNVTTYLNSVRPNLDKKAPLDPKPVASAVDKATYENALNIAQQPLIVLDKIKKGTLTAKDIQAFGNMYPNLFNAVKIKLTNAMADHISKGDAIPYKVRMSLSMFLGQPLDSTMTPTAIQTTQANSSTAKKAHQAQQGPAPASKGTKSSPALQKMSSMYQTPNQAGAARRSKVQ